MKKYIYILFILLLFSTDTLAQEDKKPKNRTAPDFTLTSVDDETISLKQLTNRGPVLICFIGVSCAACVGELAQYQKIYEELKDTGFSMIAIPLLNEKNISKVKPFVKSRGYYFPVLLDADGEAARKYYVHEVPHTFLISRGGKIVYSHSGYSRGDEVILQKKIIALLKK